MQGILFFDPENNQYLDVDGSSDTFANALEPGMMYMYLCDAASWVVWGVTPTAAANAAGAIGIPADMPFFFRVTTNDAVTTTFAAIQTSAAGNATLTPVRSSL